MKRSGTRKEELLPATEELELSWHIRNYFSEFNPVDTMQRHDRYTENQIQ